MFVSFLGSHGNHNRFDHRYNIYGYDHPKSKNEEYNHKPKSKHKHDDHYFLSDHVNDYFIPPYVKKYNKRYKQLFNLINGVLSSTNNNNHKSPNYGRISTTTTTTNNNKKSKWMEVNLFEEQRSSANPPITIEYQMSQEKNEIPGDYKLSDDHDYGFYKLSPKSKNFEYHRVSSSQSVSSPESVDEAPPITNNNHNNKSGVSRKQRLPFVAITNKRLAPQPNSRKNHRIDAQQNIFPLP